jgi:hypothetical protein
MNVLETIVAQAIAVPINPIETLRKNINENRAAFHRTFFHLFLGTTVVGSPAVKLGELCQ